MPYIRWFGSFVQKVPSSTEHCNLELERIWIYIWENSISKPEKKISPFLSICTVSEQQMQKTYRNVNIKKIYEHERKLKKVKFDKSYSWVTRTNAQLVNMYNLFIYYFFFFGVVVFVTVLWLLLNFSHNLTIRWLYFFNF